MRVKHITLSALSLLTIGVAFIGCTSTDPTFNPALITEHTWQLTGMTANPPIVKDGVAITNIFDSTSIASCDRHNLITYKPDNTMSLANDSAACGVEGDPLSWALSGDQTTLTVTQIKPTGPKVTINTIVSASDTRLVVSWVVSAEDAPDSASHVVTETYTAH